MIQCLILVTTLVATVSNVFVRRLPSAHAPRGTNAKNRACNSARVNRQKLLKRSVCNDISESLGVTMTVESKQLWKNRESHSQVCMCGMSTQQWPSPQITLFERKLQSAWLDTETTPVDKKHVNSCVLKHLLLWGSSATKKNCQISPIMLSPTRY